MDKELTLAESFIIDKIREAGEFATIRIEKNNGRLVFVASENKEKVPLDFQN